MSEYIPQSAVVVDDDQLVLRLAANILGELGVKRIDCFTDGKAAWQALQEDQYEFVCLDWKLPGLSGLALFNRLRSSKYYAKIPVLVISGFLHREDFKILAEYSCSGLLEKPFAKPGLEREFRSLCEAFSAEKESHLTLEEVVKNLDKDRRKAMKQLNKFLEEAPNPVFQVVQAAKAMRKAKRLDDAENIVRQALERDPQSVAALTELGKILHLGNRHKEASRALHAADFISPENLERLLLMGEVKLHELDAKGAKAHFEKALGIDRGSQKARAGLVSSETMIQAKHDPSLQSVPQSFASLLNIVAISKVRDGKVTEGIRQYKAALNFVHEKSTIAKVFFNLGLAYLRDNKEEVAKKWFEKSAREGGRQFSKAGYYVERLAEKALDREAEMEFQAALAKSKGNTDAGPVTPQELMDCDNIEFMEETDIMGGDLKITESVGLYGEDDDDMDEAVAYI